jgi:hypothetical protein
MQPEVLYLGSNLDHTYMFALAFLFKYNLSPRFNIQLGTQENISSENPKYQDREFRQLEMYVGFPAGVEYRFKSGGFISSRYIIRSEVENFEFAVGFNFKNN